METIFSQFSWSGFIFNVLCSLLSSFIFIFALLFLLRPKFQIVPHIAKNDSPYDDTTEQAHLFKIINRSLFGAYDIEARASCYTIRQGENGIVNKLHKKIELRTSKINYIKGCFKSKKGDNCVQFLTYEKLSEKMNQKPQSYVQFQITARHSLTGLSKSFTYDYVNTSSIKSGKFKEGSNIEII